MNGSTSPTTRRLRLWPAVLIVGLQWACMLPAALAEEPNINLFMLRMFAPMVAGAALIVWWLFASGIAWKDRFLVLVGIVAISAAAMALYHPTFRDMGPTFYVLPTLTTAWVGWLLFTPFLRWPIRRLGTVVACALAVGYFTLVRFEGVNGEFAASMPFRWTPSAEERFNAEVANKPAAKPVAATPVVLHPGDWPGFRGADRDGRLAGARIGSDWTHHPPKPLWKHRVGPGWSSIAVVDNRLYTQEQRNEKDEAVVCYDADTGAEVWVHTDSTRFTEGIAGPGPRATPTFHEGRLYSLGANGHLNCLNAADGKVIWSRDVVKDSKATIPMWGYSASPLVAGGVVLVYAEQGDGESLVAYKTADGERAWAVTAGKWSYSSPQAVKLAGADQVLMTTGGGLVSIDPATGKILWQHDWPLDEQMSRIIQPAVVGESDLLLGSPFGKGTRRLHVKRDGDKWVADEVWFSKAINPYYNDFVIDKDHLYGFENNFLTCVSLDKGERKWKERGYGNGQVLLLADQGLLLVLSETGEVALVEAKPEKRNEIARFKAIEGKTWNHPVVAHGRLYIRNGEEMACFQLPEDTGLPPGSKSE